MTFGGGRFDPTCADTAEAQEIFRRGAPREQVLDTARLLTMSVSDAKTKAQAAPFGYTDRTSIDDFSAPSLLWGIDGIFDWNMLPAGVVFEHTDHCGRLQILSTDLDPHYIYLALRPRANSTDSTASTG